MNRLSYTTRKTPPTLEVAQTAPYQAPQLEGKPLEEVLSFGHYVSLIKQRAWQIALAVTVVTVLTILYCKSVQPIYEATARITMDQRIPTAAIGQQEAVAGPTEVDQIMITEIQIIQSDPVLRPVAEQYYLLRNAEPSLLVRMAQKLHLMKSGSQSAFTNKGNDSIGDAPVVLSNLSVARLPSSLLIDIHYRSPDPRLASAVANGIAQSYLIRGAEMRAKSSMGLSTFMEKQIVELKKNMDDSSRALAGYEKELGVINPDEKTSILAARLLQLNTQYTEAENDRIRKETEFRQIQNGPSSDTPALYGAAIELSPQAAMLSRQEERLHDAEEKLAVAKTVYGPNYAEYKRAANDVAELSRQSQQTRSDISRRIEVSYQEAVNRESMLRRSLAQAKDESDRLNAHSAQYQELKRESDANTTLYNELFRKIKEAGINAGFESNSIRIADEARPPAFAIFPRLGLFTAMALLLSLMISILIVIVADMFDQSLRDPEKAGRLTGLQVVGMLPDVRDFSETYDALALAIPSNPGSLSQTESGKNWVLSKEFYAESIATLLSTVLLSRSSSRPRSILITSAGPGEGKSSCAAHLALEHASQGKKTLLIDADLRAPFQQRYFNLKLEGNPWWMTTSDTPLHAVRHKIEDSPMLDVVFFAPVTERLGFKHVGLKVSAMLQKAAIEGYDLVIVDAPPMLGLSEPIEIACATDGVLVIGDANKTSQRSVVNIVTTFERVHARLLGLILNRFRPELSESYKHYQSYSAYTRRLPAEAA